VIDEWPNISFQTTQRLIIRLNDGELGGSNVESVNISSEAGEGLLRAIRSISG